MPATATVAFVRSVGTAPVGARNSVGGADQGRHVASCVLMFRILYGFLASLARLAVRSGRAKDLEIVVLRHQLTVLQRQSTRAQLNNRDRSLLGAIAAALPAQDVSAGWPVGARYSVVGADQA